MTYLKQQVDTVLEQRNAMIAQVLSKTFERVALDVHGLAVAAKRGYTYKFNATNGGNIAMRALEVCFRWGLRDFNPSLEEVEASEACAAFKEKLDEMGLKLGPIRHAHTRDYQMNISIR